MKNSYNLKKFSSANIPLFGLLFFVILFSALRPLFFHPANLIILFLYACVNGITAFGLTPVIIGGSFDLSVGSNMALSAALAVGLQRFLPLPLCILIAMLAGASI